MLLKQAACLQNRPFSRVSARSRDTMNDSMEDSNRSSNPTIHEVSDPGRRIVMRGALGAALAALYPPFLGGCVGASDMRGSTAAGPTIGFKGIAPDTRDRVV